MIEIQGVPKRGCLTVRSEGRYPSSAIAKGMRVEVSTVALSSDRFVTMAAIVIHEPSHGPPSNCAALGRYPVCQSCQLPNAARDARVGRKYTAIESGTTMASA